jgi:hypothetical protein
MKPILVHPPGSKVGLPAAGIADAEVLTVQVRAGGYVTYELAWWVESERMTAWVEAFEVEGTTRRQRVGFLPGCE